MSQTRSTCGRKNFAQPHLVFTNDDFLTEILIRLPIMCIHLFTTILKQWLQILTSPYFTDRRRKIPNLDPPAGIFANHCRRLFKCEFVSLDPRLESRKSAMDNSFTLGSNEEADHVKILQSYNGLLLCSGSGSPVFNYSFGGREGSYEPILEQIDIPGILHLQGRLFELRGCLLLASRDDIDSREFTTYEMVKGCSVWMVRYLVNTDEFMTSLRERWLIQSTVWSIGLGEREEYSVSKQWLQILTSLDFTDRRRKITNLDPPA
ncbi:hypothetical protein Tco_0178013, partial [Tanacetum coccineum]